MSRVLIIGYGNLLRGDDGAGFVAAARLIENNRDPEVEIHAVHQLTPELMEPIHRAARVIFIDAALEESPGEVSIRSVPAISTSNAAFTHHSTPEGLLAGAQLLYGAAPPGLMISIGAVDFRFAEELSGPVQTAIDRVEKEIELLRDTGW